MDGKPVAVKKKAKTIHAVDLFCGAGGTSSGLIQAVNKLGYDIKLTDRQVEEILGMLKARVRYAVIQAKYGISKGHVGQLKRGRRRPTGRAFYREAPQR